MNNLSNHIKNVKSHTVGVTSDKLEMAITKLDKMISNTKLMKIVRSVQVERITIYHFIKDIFQKELASR